MVAALEHGTNLSHLKCIEHVKKSLSASVNGLLHNSKTQMAHVSKKATKKWANNKVAQRELWAPLTQDTSLLAELDKWRN